MKTIWKFTFEIAGSIGIKMPTGAEVLHIECQGDEPCLWALVDPQHPKESRRFRIVGTGHDIKSMVGLTFVRTFQQPPFVWHVFEQEQV